MEFCQVLGFLKILSETIKIYLKNVKLIASITTLSLLLSSILFLLFSFSSQSATTYMTNSFPSYSTSGGILISLMIIFFALVFAVEITFLFSYIAIANAAGVGTVITAAASYTDTKLSLRDLFSAVKTKRKTPFRYNFRRSGNPWYFLRVVAMTAAVWLVMFYPNPATIAIVAVGGVAIFVYSLYASVIPALAAVIPVLEDGCEAAEKAEKLVEGQRVHGFMVNVFINILALIVCLGFWMVVGDQGKLNLTVYGLFFVDCALLTRIFMSVVYTVYYFQCKEYHRELIQPLGNSNYTKLSSDIP